MNEDPRSRAAELAAQQVEAIVSAAQTAAEQIRAEAEQDAARLRRQGEQRAAAELEAARRDAISLSNESRDQADKLLAEARRESSELRERAQSEAKVRVSAAEEAAEEVMADARTLTNGLRRLGESLTSQGERILRDVQAAHRRMQADLRVDSGRGPAAEVEPPRPASRRREPAASRRGEQASEEELLERVRRAHGTAEGGTRSRSSATRGNPIEDLEVPTWVTPDE